MVDLSIFVLSVHIALIYFWGLNFLPTSFAFGSESGHHPVQYYISNRKKKNSADMRFKEKYFHTPHVVFIDVISSFLTCSIKGVHNYTYVTLGYVFMV